MPIAGMTLVEIIVSLMLSMFLVVVVMRSFLPLVSGEQQTLAINHNREILRSFETAIAEKLLFKKEIVSGTLAERNLIMFSMINSNGQTYRTLRCSPFFFRDTQHGSNPPKYYSLMAGEFGSGKFASKFLYSSKHRDFKPIGGSGVPKPLNDARERCLDYGHQINLINDQTSSLNFCVKISSDIPRHGNGLAYSTADEEEFKKISHQVFSSQNSIFSEIHVDFVDLRTGEPVICKNVGSLENVGAHIFYTMYWHKERFQAGNIFFSRKSGYFLGTPNSN